MVLVQWYCEAIVKYGMHRPFRMEQDGPVRSASKMQRTKDEAIVKYGTDKGQHTCFDHSMSVVDS